MPSLHTVNTTNRQAAFEWFGSFTNPCYGMNVRMDVSSAVNCSKRYGLSFFVFMLYAVTTGLNKVDELRMRIIGGKPVIFDAIDPSYTVAKGDGFANVRHSYSDDFAEFYRMSKLYTESAVSGKPVRGIINNSTYNPDDKWNEFYMTCTPWTDFSSMTHPIPDTRESQSVPRICWGKYREHSDNRYFLTLNITVNHMLVDGKPLSRAFAEVQNVLDNAEALITNANIER